MLCLLAYPSLCNTVSIDFELEHVSDTRTKAENNDDVGTHTYISLGN